MRKIIIALIILSFKFDFNIESMTISLIPDFVGYVMIVNGIKEMSVRREAFRKTEKIANVMVYYSVFVFVYQLAAGGLGDEVFSYLINGIDAIGAIYMLLAMTKAILEIQQNERIDLPYQSLKLACRFLIIFRIIIMLCGLIQETVELYMFIGAMGSLISMICYIVTLNDCKRIMEW